MTPAGVTTTNDWADVIDLGADCVTYFANSIGREREAIADLVPFLERGTNVVTFSGFEIAHPASAPPELREPIEAACRAGGSSCYFTGIDPGWATTDLAIASLAAANRVDCIRVLELGWWGDYTAEFVCREYFGFGKEPGFQPLLVTGGFIEKMWAPTLHQLAEVLGGEVEEFRVVYETTVSTTTSKPASARWPRAPHPSFTLSCRRFRPAGRSRSSSTWTALRAMWDGSGSSRSVRRTCPTESRSKAIRASPSR